MTYARDRRYPYPPQFITSAYETIPCNSGGYDGHDGGGADAKGRALL